MTDDTLHCDNCAALRADLLAEVKELRAELAANRLDRAGLLPDWELTPYGAILRNGEDYATVELRSIREQGYAWDVTVRGRQTFGNSGTARQAMRDADAALAKRAQTEVPHAR